MVDKQELSSAGLKFMDFAIRFFNMAKCQSRISGSFYFKYARIYTAYYEFSG